jgi:glycine cleavage system aminomethyltransferase T
MAAAVLPPICDHDLADLPRVSRRGDACGRRARRRLEHRLEQGGRLQIYPFGSARAVEIWDGLVEVGGQRGLLVTGPNVVAGGRAGHHRHAVACELGHEPAGTGADPHARPGRRRHCRASGVADGGDAGPRRATIGLTADGDPVPRLGDFWPVLNTDGVKVGIARWAVWSYALESSIAIALIDSEAAAEQCVLRAPTAIAPRPHPIPSSER